MPDVHHVAILHDVVFAFEAQRAFGAGVGFGAGFEQLIPADGFSANEMLLQIGWMAPAASTARVRTGMVQARHSSSPAVKNEIRPSNV